MNRALKTAQIKFNFSLLVLLLGLIFTPCFSQYQVVFSKINQSNGLSNDRVRSIVKEKNGFVWIGTDNGLNRYDGNKIKIFNKQNSALSSNDISDLLIDRKGIIWIATVGGGLNVYNPASEKFKVYKNDLKSSATLPSNELNTLFEDSIGTIWLGTKNGLAFFDAQSQTFKSFKFDSKNNFSLSNNDVRSIFEDNNRALWIGTFGGGLNKFDLATGKCLRIKSSSGIAPDYIHSLCGINKNQILIGTSGNGLITFDIARLNFQKKAYGIDKSIQIVRTIKKDHNGSIWVGTDGNGLFKISNINGLKLSVYNYTNSLQTDASISSNAIYALLEDENNNIWIGNAWSGVDVISTNKEFSFLPSNAKNESPVSVLSIYKNNEALFMGLDGKGLTVFSTNFQETKRYNSFKKNAIGDDYIQFINQAKNGSLWIGTFVNGLVNFNYKTGRFSQFKQNIYDSKSLSYNDVRYIIEDNKSNFWVATWGGGLNYFDVTTKQFKVFKKNATDRNSISNDNVLALQKDGHLIWAATFGGGLNVLNTITNSFSNYKSTEGNQNSLSSDYLYSMLKDSKGNIWLGTAGEGINCLNPNSKQVNRFDAHKNIRYQTVMSIIEDNNGLIWFSTKQGIFNFDYKTKSFKNFSILKGDYHINSCFKDNNGMLYFGSSKGVVSFNPNQMKVKNSTPKVKFTAFKLFNKEVHTGEDEILKNDISVSKNILLKYNQDVITFEFAAMLFPSSANCEYQIKMENFDQNWRSIGKEGSATYTNLSPGDYVFKVKSRELGSNWSEKYSALDVIIQKPFWTEWWAFVIYVLTAILVLYTIIKYIISWEKMKADYRLEKFAHEKDLELNKLKQDFFTNISHEIRTPVTLILSSINKLLKSNQIIENQENKSLKTITKNGEYLLNLVNELLDFRKLDDQKIKLNVYKSNWVEFCNEIYLSFKEFAIQKNINFEFEYSNPEIEVWFDKNQMEKVLYNLFSNALKFTNPGKSIKFSITETETEVNSVLLDQGIGISKKHLSKIFNRFYQTQASNNANGAGFGLGLSISNEIIKLHHGTINVESELGVGSMFTLTLKKGNSFFDVSQVSDSQINEEQIEHYFSVQKDKIEFDSHNDKNPINKEQTLLIVEDNPDISNYIVDLLSDEFSIMQAFDGAKGFEIALESAPDLIISDVMMPIMNGIELTHQLKSNVNTSHIPIILLTARASLMNQMEGFETGADDYVTKPFNETLLRTRIKNIIKNRTLLHEKFKSNQSNLIGDFVKNTKDRHFLEKLAQILDANIEDENLSAVLVSKELGMSHSVLYKKIKIITGLSLVEYMRDYRLNLAMQLLQTKQFPVNEICYKVGYSDRKYFSKLFKERFGNPPSFYIKEQ